MATNPMQRKARNSFIRNVNYVNYYRSNYCVFNITIN